MPFEWRPATVGREEKNKQKMGIARADHERGAQEAQVSYVGSESLLIALGSYQNVIMVNCP